MPKTKGYIAREYAPQEPRRRVRKINEANRKGINNPFGHDPYMEEPAEVAVADFDATGTDWRENFLRELEQERISAGE